MFLINNSRTGISELDIGITNYFEYLAKVNVLPMGNYVLAGGAIRSLLDKTRVKDLDIYVLGSKQEHDIVFTNILSATIPDTSVGLLKNIITLATPFVQLRLITIPENLVTMVGKTRPAESTKEKEFGEVLDQDYSNLKFSSSIQLMSFAYDSNYKDRILKTTPREERFADIYASTGLEIISSFDNTISKGSIEFFVYDTAIVISSVNIPSDCLIDIGMRTLRLADNDLNIPQQLCSIERFHKFIQLGYNVSDSFYKEWNFKLRANPHVLELSYDFD